MITVLNKNQVPVGVLANDLPKACPYFNDVHTEALENSLSLLEFEIPANHPSSSLLEVEGYIIYTDLDKKKLLFQIKEITHNRNGKEVTKKIYAENSAVADLNGVIVRPITMNSYSIQQAMNVALEQSDWRLGRVDFIGVKDFAIDEHITALEALHTITKEFGAELEYEVVFNGTRIVSKHINVLDKRGKNTGKLFSYEKDITGVERVEDTRGLITALIGVGKGDESGTLMTFDRLTNYPQSDRFIKSGDTIFDMEAFQRFNKGGRHIFGVFKDDKAETTRQLFDNTLEKLKDLSKPRLTYSVDVVLLEELTGYSHEQVRLGDTIKIQDASFKPMLVLEARVIELKRSQTNPTKSSVTLGDYVPLQITSNSMLKKLQNTIFKKQQAWDDATVRITEAIEDARTALETGQRAEEKADGAIQDIGLLDERVEGTETAITETNKEVAKKVDGTVYSQKMLEIENELAGKIAEVIYNNDKALQDAEIAKKVAQDVYNAKVLELQGNIDKKVAQDTYNQKVIELQDSIDAKVAQTAYNTKVTELQGNIDKKVATDKFNTTIQNINQNIADKADLEYVNGELVSKANKADTYTKTEVNTALNGKVSTTTYTTDKNGIVQRLDDAETAITQNADEIALKASQTELDAVEGRLGTAETSITQHAKQIALKATQTEVDEIKGRVSTAEGTLTVHAEEIASKVSQTDYNTLTGRMGKAETSITQNATAIASKASQSSVNALGTRMTDAETAITQNAEQIALKATQTDVDALDGRMETAESALTIQAGEIASKVSKTEFDNAIEGVDGRLSGAETSITQHAEQIGLKASQTDVNALKTRVSNTETSITQHAEQIALKATQEDLNTVEGRVSTAEATLTVQAEEIASKVSKTDYNALSGRVSKAETSITQNAEDIATKASQTSVNALGTRMGKAETAITQNAEQIALKASQEVVDTIDGRLDTAESTITLQAEEIASKVASTTFNALEGRVDTAESTLTQHAGQIASKVEKTTYETDMNGVTTRLGSAESGITQNAEAIKSKVAQTDFNTLKGRVDSAESTITQHAGMIQSKVEQTTFNKLDGKVSGLDTRLGTAESTITQHANSIASKVEQTTFNALDGRVKTAESAITQHAKDISSKVSSVDFTDGIKGVEKYVQSRTENLVTNGTGLLGDNTNFSQWTFDGSQVYAGGGSFFTALQNGTRFNDEMIPVDPSRKYRFSLMAKSKTGLGHNYFGVVSYDIDGQQINPYSFYGSQYPVTTLAKDLKVGDTEIHLTSSEGFMDDQATPNHRHSIVFWGYKNSFGYEYPEGTYSRLYFTIGWNKDAINRTTHVITLNKPFNVTNPNDPNGVFKAGHKVSPTSSGGSYQYMTASNVKVSNTEWQKFEGTITGNGISSFMFPHGTAFVKLMLLVNRSTSGGTAGDNLWVNSLEFTDLTKEENAKSYTDISIEPIGVRLSNAEERITDDSIINTVTSSTTFTNALDEKANAEALGDMVTKDELEQAKADAENYADGAVAGIDFSPYITESKLSQTRDEISVQFSKAGGVNLIRNSVGFAGTDYWTNVTANVSTIQDETLNSLGFGSGFYFSKVASYLSAYQIVDVIAGQPHTLSWYENITELDAGGYNYVFIYDGDATTAPQIYSDTTLRTTTNGYQQRSNTFTPTTNKVMVRFGSYKAETVFTGIMLNVGETALQWSLATGEVYNANVTMNSNGIRVYNSEYEGYTQVTPQEFAGYAEVDGQMKRVFTLNKDVTEMSKAQIENEITMAPVKIVPLKSGMYNGLAFVKSE